MDCALKLPPETEPNPTPASSALTPIIPKSGRLIVAEKAPPTKAKRPNSNLFKSPEWRVGL
jgi:hypothetical protein